MFGDILISFQSGQLRLWEADSFTDFPLPRNAPLTLDYFSHSWLWTIIDFNWYMRWAGTVASGIIEYTWGQAEFTCLQELDMHSKCLSQHSGLRPIFKLNSYQILCPFNAHLPEVVERIPLPLALKCGMQFQGRWSNVYSRLTHSLCKSLS